MRDRGIGKLWAVALSLNVAGFSIAPAWAATCNVGLPSAQFTPLTDFQAGELYLGLYPGKLYSNGTNIAPDDHIADGLTFAANIVPRLPGGQQNDTNGKIVFLSLGFSNNTIEFCGGNAFFADDPDDPRPTACPAPKPLQHHSACTSADSFCPYNQPESFMGQAFTETHSPPHDGKIWPVDGAKANRTLETWDPTIGGYTEYDRVRDEILTPAGLSEAQVQSIWFKSADNMKRDLNISLPDPNADAFTAETRLGNIMRAIRLRYPNARQVFISPRTYGGYASVAHNPLNPEPYAYELGFAIKWLVDAQIQEMRPPHTIDPIAGDLRYGGTGSSPLSTWIDWGPYIWADGHNCPTGFACLNSDFRGPSNNGVQNECTHPSTSGEQKVGKQLLDFINASAYTNWFRTH